MKPVVFASNISSQKNLKQKAEFYEKTQKQDIRVWQFDTEVKQKQKEGPNRAPNPFMHCCKAFLSRERDLDSAAAAATTARAHAQ